MAKDGFMFSTSAAATALITVLAMILGPSPGRTMLTPRAPIFQSRDFQSPETPLMSTSSGRGLARWSWPVHPRPAVLRSFDRPPEPWLAGHRGVDLTGPPGTTVHAPAGGRVAFTGRVAGREVITLEHSGGLRSSFEPIAAPVALGTVVQPGERIADLESDPETLGKVSHCPSRNCLHWGVREDRYYLDPLSLLGVLRPSVLLPLRSGAPSLASQLPRSVRLRRWQKCQ